MAKQYNKINNTYIKGGSGTNDYNDLYNIPLINNVPLRNSLTLAQLGIIIPDMGNYYDKTEMNIMLNTINESLILLNENKLNRTDFASDYVGGIIKTNSSQNIFLDENNVLNVLGRLGQKDNGLYYPLTIQPEYMDKNTLLISELTGMRLDSNRILGIIGGVGVTCNRAEAGATEYIVNNTQANRFMCAMAKGGYATLNQKSAGTLCAKVLSVKLQDGTDLIPYSGATESNNKIVITLDKTINPSATTTTIRLYGSLTFDTTFVECMGGGTGGITGKGKVMMVGQSLLCVESNSILVGNSIYNAGTRSALFGFQHINTQIASFMAGQGHDSSNGKVGVGAIGSYSNIKENTAFAIGNGTSTTERSNIFEVTDDEGATGIIMKSPNGTRYKLKVNDNGELITELEV